MSDAKLFAITGFGGGVSVGLQADNFQEFEVLAQSVFGPAAGSVFAREVFNALKSFAPAAGATATVDQGLGVAAVTNVGVPAQPVSTVGQPLPVPQPQVVTYMPVAQPQQQAAPQANAQRIAGPAGAPPGVVYPGPCAHGDRVYNDKPARGKAWRRWECAIPWSRNAVGRCDAINVEA